MPASGSSLHPHMSRSGTGGRCPFPGVMRLRGAGSYRSTRWYPSGPGAAQRRGSAGAVDPCPQPLATTLPLPTATTKQVSSRRFLIICGAATRGEGVRVGAECPIPAPRPPSRCSKGHPWGLSLAGSRLETPRDQDGCGVWHCPDVSPPGPYRIADEDVDAGGSLAGHPQDLARGQPQQLGQFPGQLGCRQLFQLHLLVQPWGQFGDGAVSADPPPQYCPAPTHVPEHPSSAPSAPPAGSRDT